MKKINFDCKDITDYFYGDRVGGGWTFIMSATDDITG